MNKKFIILVFALIIVLGIYRFWLLPIKYWFKSPTSFKECVEATRGLIIQTNPPQCEWKEINFKEE